MRNKIAEELLKKTAAYVPSVEVEGGYPPEKVRPWNNWLKAELGWRNHWYPAQASRNLPEGCSEVIKLLGEDILFLRRNGKLHAIEDRCAHRGARFSKRPLTYTSDTITCWHHTFTFDLDDGRIRCLLNEPDSPLCGSKGIKVYPVEEAKGVVFVFIGDIEAPPLRHDVPPGFLDEDVAICVADPYVVKANWRLGSEGGFDPGHHFIHNWSKFAVNARIPMTFGWVPNQSVLLETNLYQNDPDGPRGFNRLASEADVSSTVATIPSRDGKSVREVVLPIAAGHTAPEKEAYEQAGYEGVVGAWLPCSLKVEPWPFPGVIHNEYYVPRDANSHYYFQCGWFTTTDPALKEEWVNGELGQVRWKKPVVDDFTIDDAFAREGTNEFYANENGYEQERVANFDTEVLMWRTFASENARGIQEVRHTKGLFKR